MNPGFVNSHRYDSAEHDFFLSCEVMLFGGAQKVKRISCVQTALGTRDKRRSFEAAYEEWVVGAHIQDWKRLQDELT